MVYKTAGWKGQHSVLPALSSLSCSPYVSLCVYNVGSVFGNTDYFTGLGVFLDTYSNYNGEHMVSGCGKHALLFDLSTSLRVVAQFNP